MEILDQIKPFCGKVDQCRWRVAEPFQIGEYVYATDTKILARFKGHLSDPPKLETDKRHPPADEIVKWENHFPLQYPDKIPKSASVRKLVTCEDCDGKGTFNCTCPNCDLMLHDCLMCEGEGKQDETKEITIACGRFDLKLFRKVLALPDVKIEVDYDKKAKSGKMFFESGEIQGVLQGLGD